jgi:hemin uptake protein HemP
MREPKHEPVESRPIRAEAPPPLDSAELFKSRDELVIRHVGELYRLRRTRNGKLILTK